MKTAALLALLATASCGCGPCPPDTICIGQYACRERGERGELTDSALCGRTCAGRGAEPFRYDYGACTQDSDKVLDAAIAKCKSAGLLGCVNPVCGGCETLAGCKQANAD